MTDTQKFFLLVAEEMSISRAAAKAFISQQAMSAHIQRLEKQYGTALFNRRPRLSLTQAGERLLYMLRQVQQLEEAFERETGSQPDIVRGHINIGITYARATVMLPAVLRRYNEKYPGVDISIQTNFADNLENRLLFGYLDFAISTWEMNSPQLEATVLSEEEVYLIASENLLRRYFGENWESVCSGGLTLAELAGLPLISLSDDENLGCMLGRRLKEHAETLNNVLIVDNPDIRCQLCAQDVGATFIPRLLLPYVTRQNRGLGPGNRMKIIPLHDVELGYKTFAYRRKNAYYPEYIHDFVTMYAENCRAVSAAVERDIFK